MNGIRGPGEPPPARGDRKERRRGGAVQPDGSACREGSRNPSLDVGRCGLPSDACGSGTGRGMGGAHGAADPPSRRDAPCCRRDAECGRSLSRAPWRAPCPNRSFDGRAGHTDNWISGSVRGASTHASFSGQQTSSAKVVGEMQFRFACYRNPGRLVVDDRALIVAATLEGCGLAHPHEALVAGLVARGDLVRVLEDWCPVLPSFFLYYPGRRQMPGPLRAFIAMASTKAPAPLRENQPGSGARGQS